MLLVRGLGQNLLFLRAAALTLATLLGLIPLLAIMLFVIQTFDIDQDVYGYISKMIRPPGTAVGPAPLPLATPPTAPPWPA